MASKQIARHALRETNQQTSEDRDTSLAFRQDFRDLPAFRQTIKVRGWNGLHRPPAAPEQAMRERKNAQ